MRTPKALSPTSLRLWRTNREEFYLSHLAERRAPKPPQTRPMAIGSAFDAAVKSTLAAMLFGVDMSPSLTFAALFESQVETHNRDWAFSQSSHAMSAYRRSGALDDLLDLLRRADKVQFEFEVTRTVQGVPLKGRPDCHFSLYGVYNVLDWKCKGYCSTASPSPGYVLCRDGWAGKPSRSHNTQHPAFVPCEFAGQRIASDWFEQINRGHAEQLAIYSWLEGHPVGCDEVVLHIEELVGQKSDGEFPRVRVANHRGRASAGFQRTLMAEAAAIWQAITSGHVFAELSRADSDARCAALEQTAASLATEEDTDYVVRQQ